MYKKVILISLPKQDLLRPPGALPILAAACEEYSIDYEVRDFNLALFNNLDLDTWNQINDNWNAVNPFDNRNTAYYQKFLVGLKLYVDWIISDSPDLIAISVFSDDSSYCADELIAELNSRPERSSFDIAIGGTGIRARLPHYELEFCRELLSKKQIDFYLFGEGEVVFRKLLQKQTTYPGINNFDAVQIDDLDQFPFPSYNKINPRDYKYLTNPELIVTGSRGCVRKCTYCDVARYWPKYRYRGGKNIADEIYHYYKTVGVRHFEFSDSLINGSLKQFKEMNQALIEYQKADPDFWISYKGQYICRDKTQMKEVDYANMKQAGCDYIYVGVESFSDQVRHDMDKKFNNEDLDYHLEMCGRYGIANSFLMLVGYPTETLEDHQKNLDALVKYQKYALSGIIEMIAFGYTAGVLEDTPLFHMQDELALVPEVEDPMGVLGPNWVSLSNPTLTLKERVRRWVELTELGFSLGYSMPRLHAHISKFITGLTLRKTQKAYKIKQS